MRKSLSAVSALWLVSLSLAGSELLAQRAQRPSLFVREDWTFAAGQPNVNTPQEPEHPVIQGDVANPNVDVHLWGDKTGLLTVNQPDNNNLTYVMTLLCTTSCAVTFRDRNNDVDLTGLATIRSWLPRANARRSAIDAKPPGILRSNAVERSLTTHTKARCTMCR